MQLSAANLLLAAQQQAARQAPQPKAPAFAAAPAAETKREKLFAPLDFKPAAAPQPKLQAAPGQVQRPGANLDIRV